MIVIVNVNPENTYENYCSEAMYGEPTYRISKDTERYIISYIDVLLRNGLRYCDIYRYLMRKFGVSLISEISRKRIYEICDAIMRDENVETISIVKEVI